MGLLLAETCQTRPLMRKWVKGRQGTVRSAEKELKMRKKEGRMTTLSTGVKVSGFPNPRKKRKRKPHNLNL